MVKHWHTGDRFTDATGEDVAEGPAWLRSHMARFRRELAARPRKRAKPHRLMAALVARAFAMGPAGTLGAVAAVAVQAVRERCAARRVDAGMSVGQPAPGERLADDGAMAGVEVPVQAVDARVGQQHWAAASQSMSTNASRFVHTRSIWTRSRNAITSVSVRRMTSTRGAIERRNTYAESA